MNGGAQIQGMTWYPDLLELAGIDGVPVISVIDKFPLSILLSLDQRCLFELISARLEASKLEKKIFSQALIAQIILRRIMLSIEEDLLDEYEPKFAEPRQFCEDISELIPYLRRQRKVQAAISDFLRKHQLADE